MKTPDQGHVWGGGTAYESYMGRWSRLVAREFLVWLALPAEGRWLDVGCGTGVLSRTILEMAMPEEVLGIDPAEGFIEYARKEVTDSRVRFEVGDAIALRHLGARFEAVVSGLVLNFLPDPKEAVAEMIHAARQAGTVAGYVWDYADGMQMIRLFWDAAVTLDPATRNLDEGLRFPLCKPEALTELFESAGLRDVEVRPIDVHASFRDFDDYWSSFLGGQGPAPGYAASLSEERRAALRERVRVSILTASDGSFGLVARAWAVRGIT